MKVILFEQTADVLKKRFKPGGSSSANSRLGNSPLPSKRI
jgi:hypothetical protein